MSASELRIDYLPIAGLKPSPRNARTHSKKQLRQIADSIDTFGFTNPVLIDDTMTILAGHGRVEAAKLLDLDTVPCVRLSHMTADQKRAYVLADNKLALNAGWCGSAWKKDPISGLIGVEQGPPHSDGLIGCLAFRWRDRDVDSGDGCSDPAGARGWEGDQGDRAGFAAFAQGCAQGDPIAGMRFRV